MANWNILADAISDMGDYVLKDAFEQKAYERKARVENELMLQRGEMTHGYNMKEIEARGKIASDEAAIKREHDMSKLETEYGYREEETKLKGGYDIKKAEITAAGKNKDAKVPGALTSRLKAVDTELKDLMKLKTSYSEYGEDTDPDRLMQVTDRINLLRQRQHLLNRLKDAKKAGDASKVRAIMQELQEKKASTDLPLVLQSAQNK